MVMDAQGKEHVGHSEDQQFESLCGQSQEGPRRHLMSFDSRVAAADATYKCGCYFVSEVLGRE